MSWDIVEANWATIKEEVKDRWGELNDVHLADIGGKRINLSSHLQDIYVIPLEEAEDQIVRFEAYIKDLLAKKAA